MSCRQRCFKISCMLLVFTIIISSLIVPNSYADPINKNVKAPINLIKEVERNQYLVNEEFIINYMIQPQPIPVEDIVPESYLKDKEIVLVIDSSGSMDWDINGNRNVSNKNKRMTIAKDAAKLFIDNFSDKNNVKIGLVDYDTKSKVEDIDGKELVNSKKLNKLKTRINNGLQAKGATNIGDGLRRAYWILRKSSDNDTKKYIVLMTDGEPTALSMIRKETRLEKKWTYRGWQYINIYYPIYKLDDGEVQDNKIWNFGSNDPKGYALEYANVIASQKIALEDPYIDTFIIGFSNGINKDKLQEIADNSNGFYKEAKTAEDITEVYEKLAEQIQSDLPIHGIRFQETFPEGMDIADASLGLEINGQIVTGDIGSISYMLNEETNQFEAEPFKFFIKLRGNAAGNYNLGKDGSDNNISYIDYRDIDGTDGQKSFPGIDISVYEEEPPEISAHLTDHETNNDNYSLALTIDEPAEIEVLNTEGDILWTRDERPNNYQSDKTFTIDITKSDVNGMFVNMNAKDKYNNSVEETIPLIRLMPIEIQDSTKTPEGLKGRLSLETEINSTITSIKVNGVIIAMDRLTGEGRYTQLIDLVYDENEIEISVKNDFNNTSTLKFSGITVEGPTAPPDISIKVKDGEGVRDSYEIPSDIADKKVKKILNSNIVLKGDSFADISVIGEEVDYFKYQFMNTSVEPQDMPENGWLDLDLNEETINEDVVLEKQGHLNQRAYDVSHMPTLSGNDKWSNPQEVFKTPFEATYHKSASFSTSAAEYGDWEDYNKADGTTDKRWVANSIFMKNMNVTGANGNKNQNYKESSKFWGYIKVPTDGGYKFGANSDDGSKGYITVEGETKNFVNMFKPQGSKFGTTNEVFHLKANKFYPIYLEYFNWGGWAHFEMKYSDDSSSPSTRVPADWFYPSKNITPGEYDKTIFTGSEGVKFPTESGDYYILFKTGNNNEVTREGIYGPFTVDGKVSLNLYKEVIDGNIVQEKDAFKLKYTIQPEDIKATSTYKNENGVYNESISLTNVLLEDKYPANIDIATDSGDADIVVNGESITVNMLNIEYKLTDKGGEQVYSADTVSFVVDLSTDTPGNYTLSESGKSIISFTDINKANSQMEFPAVTINAKDKNSAGLNFDRTINKSEVYLEEQFAITYEISPQRIKALDDVSNLPETEIVRDIVFTETIPEGITIKSDNLPSEVSVEGQIITYSVDSISYNLNEAEKTYEPDTESLSFEISGYGEKTGDFELGEGSLLKYKDIDELQISVSLVEIDRISIEKGDLPVPVIEAETEWTNATDVPVKITADIAEDSGVKIQYKLLKDDTDEGKEILDWTDYEGSFDIRREGETKILARTTDDSGDLSGEVSSIVKIDRTRPSINIDTPIMEDDIISESEEENVTIEGNTGKEGNIRVTVVISDKDGKEVTKIIYSDSDGNFKIDGFDVSDLADGRLTITATATDKAGNSAYDTKVVNDILSIEKERITDAKGYNGVDRIVHMIKNGKLIVKVGFTLEGTADELRVKLALKRGSENFDDEKYEFKKMKLEFKGDEHTNWDINGNTIVITSVPGNGDYEATLEFDVIKDDGAKADESKYKIIIDSFEGIKSDESDTYNPDPDPTLLINIVDDPNIL